MFSSEIKPMFKIIGTSAIPNLNLQSRIVATIVMITQFIQRFTISDMRKVVQKQEERPPL